MRPILARVAALVLLALAACADPSAPAVPAAPDAPAAAAPSLNVGGANAAYDSYDYVAAGQVVKRTDSLSRAVWTWTYVSPKREASLELRDVGLKVTIPAGAVAEGMYVWVVAYPGDDVLYEFGPHGTEFQQPIVIQQDLRLTTAYRTALIHELFGGYAPNGRADVASDGSVQLAETFAVELRPDNHRKPRWAKFTTTHFSGYVLASGRREY